MKPDKENMSYEEAVLDACVTSWVPTEGKTPRQVVLDLLLAEQQVALDPAVSAEAKALYDKGYAEGKADALKPDPVDAFLLSLEVTSFLMARKALAELYDTMDRWMSEGRFDLCDRAMDEVNLSKFPSEIILGFWCVTAPAKDLLLNRKQYRERAVRQIISRGSDRDKDLLAAFLDYDSQP